MKENVKDKKENKKFNEELIENFLFELNEFELKDNKNFIFHYINNNINQIYTEILNDYSYNKITSLMNNKIEDDESIQDLKKELKEINLFILQILQNERDMLYQKYNLESETMKISMIKMLNTWKNKLNLNTKEFITILSLYQNYSKLFNTEKDINDPKTINGMNLLNNYEYFKNEIFSNNIILFLNELITHNNKVLKSKIVQLQEELVKEEELEKNMILNLEKMVDQQ